MEVASLKRGGATLPVHEDGYVSEDEQIQNLEETGQMQQVIGSQSILSQELHNLEPSQASQSGEVFSQDMGAFSQVSVRTTATADFDSQQLAHQYGLLSQDPAARAARTSTRRDDVFESQGSSSHSGSQGGFGTLLDAVQMFQSQEEEEERELKRRREAEEANSENGAQSVDEFGAIAARKEKKARTSAVATRSQSRSKEKESPDEKTVASSDSKKIAVTKKPNLPLTKNNSNNIVKAEPINVTTGNRKRKRKDDGEQLRLQKMAQRAADLAQRTINDPELAKRLLLSMALTRENPRSAPETLPAPGHVLPEGFFWAHYPPLEKGNFQPKDTIAFSPKFF